MKTRCTLALLLLLSLMSELLLSLKLSLESEVSRFQLGFRCCCCCFFMELKKKKNSICPHTTDQSMISRLQQVLESNLWLPAKDCDTIMILVLGRFCQRSGFIAEMNFPCSSQNISRKVVTLDFSERKLSLVYKSNLERNQKEKDTGRKKLRKAKEKDRQKKRRQKERLKERNPDFILYISKYDHHGESSFFPLLNRMLQACTQGRRPLAGQIILKTCTFPPETEFTPLFWHQNQNFL